ncbi:zinc ribbon domain-containing protein [Butyrivibrio sp. AC2005]|uniref:zinc ribbon domain-containing protein n=1 Tax=Butyrivibrio sp. AC2005 TaxID=1280672 RepID=UPI0004129B90|nr:zinc ribbon domain-containing protein [Butyrivibrio sp. AC2005]
MQENSNSSLVTVNNIVRLLATVCIVLVFCPTCMVSCAGKETGVSLMTLVEGITTDFGGNVLDPHPIALVCLLLPIAILACSMSKTMTEDNIATVFLLCSSVDLIGWIAFKYIIENAAKKYYFDFKMTEWYVINIISISVIILFSILVLVKKVHLDENPTSIKGIGTGSGKGDPKIPKDKIMGKCPTCHKYLVEGDQFCTSCGTLIPKEIITNYINRPKGNPKPTEKSNNDEFYCNKCGTLLHNTENLRFCIRCGTKIIHCSRCGAVNFYGDEYCVNCGDKL